METIQVTIQESLKKELHTAIGDCINNRIEVLELQTITQKVMKEQSTQIDELYKKEVLKRYNNIAHTVEELFVNHKEYLDFQLELSKMGVIPNPTSVTIFLDPTAEMLVSASINVQNKKLNQ